MIGIELIPWGFAIIGTIIAGVAVQRLEAKPRLLVFYPGQLAFNIRGNAGNIIPIQTNIVTVQNVGRAVTENVEIVFSAHVLDDQIRVTPPLPFEVTDRQGSMVIGFPTLGPKEHATVQLLSLNGDVPLAEHVRSKDGPALNIPVQLQRVFPGWVIQFVLLLMLVGFATSLWFLAAFALKLYEVIGV